MKETLEGINAGPLSRQLTLTKPFLASHCSTLPILMLFYKLFAATVVASMAMGNPLPVCPPTAIVPPT